MSFFFPPQQALLFFFLSQNINITQSLPNNITLAMEAHPHKALLILQEALAEFDESWNVFSQMAVLWYIWFEKY